MVLNAGHVEMCGVFFMFSYWIYRKHRRLVIYLVTASPKQILMKLYTIVVLHEGNESRVLREIIRGRYFVLVWSILCDLTYSSS